MKGADELPADILTKYEVLDWRNAIAILSTVHEEAFGEVLDVLARFQLRFSSIATGGGNKSPVSRFIDSELYARGWTEKSFDTAIVVDGEIAPSPTHSVDCVKGRWRWRWNGTTRIRSSTAISTISGCSTTCESSMPG
ncbi:MAG: BglII/BstYI family type II restriction endonuclease [Zhengella sp.]